MRFAFIQPQMLLAGVLGLALFGLCAGEALGQTQEDAKPAALPASVDLRPQFRMWGLDPVSQGKRNTCSVFVTTGALEFAASKHFEKATPLSVEYLNWACNQVIGNKTADRGQFFHHLLKGYEQFGICAAKEMPYQKQFLPELKPSDAAAENAKAILGLSLRVHWINPWKKTPGLTDEQLLEMKTVLAKGYPVAAGSGHSLLVVGYVDDKKQPGGGKFFTKDSGRAAFNSVNYAVMKEKFGDVFWVEAREK